MNFDETWAGKGVFIHSDASAYDCKVRLAKDLWEKMKKWILNTDEQVFKEVRKGL